VSERVAQEQPLPLAGASALLRGKPGRPRKHPEFGHVPGTLPPQILINSGAEHSASDSQSIAPRLLDVQGAAAYLSVSVWTIRDLEAAGELPRVRLQVGRSEVRRLLFDRRDLDRLVDRSRGG
jgi:hypothetical protein